jgi:hypothetical protein
MIGPCDQYYKQFTDLIYDSLHCNLLHLIINYISKYVYPIRPCGHSGKLFTVVTYDCSNISFHSSHAVFNVAYLVMVVLLRL